MFKQRCILLVTTDSSCVRNVNILKHFVLITSFCSFYICILYFNLFNATGLFLCPLKTLENPRLFDVFFEGGEGCEGAGRGYKQRSGAWNGLNNKVFVRITFRNEPIENSVLMKAESVQHFNHKSGYPKAVVQNCSVKTVFLKILQNLQKNTRATVSFLIKLQAQPY